MVGEMFFKFVLLKVQGIRPVKVSPFTPAVLRFFWKYLRVA